MPLGGYAPLPLRLGGNELTGLTAEQWKRVGGSMTCSKRTTASAFFHILKSGSTVTITNYYGANGNGANNAPVATVNGTGDVTLAFTPPVWVDPWDQTHQIWIRAAMVGSNTSANQAVVQVVDHRSVRLRMFSISGGAAADGGAIVELWFDRRPRIGDYGAWPDKTNSLTEGRTPRAYSIYRELKAMRGDAYSRATSGYVHIEDLALARFLAWIWYRIPEEAVCNQTPSTADSRLGYWVTVLGVPNRPQDQKWEVRERAIVKFKRMSGASRAEVDAAFKEQMGSSLVQIVRNDGTSLANPPSFTFWPSGDTGPVDLDLGGGTWATIRSHLYFVLSRGLLADPDNFNRVANSALFELADNILPAWANFSWYLDGSGFIVEVSLVGFDAV